MTLTELQAKLDEARASAGETECIEFKQNSAEPDVIGQNLSALSNAAALRGRSHGYIIWGVEDGTHRLVGTSFRPSTKKGAGNDDLEPWLARMLSPRIDFHIHEFAHEGKAFVVFEVQAANSTPVAFSGKEWVRVGSHSKPLKDYPEKERALWAVLSAAPFESGVARVGLSEKDVAALLDYEAYFRLAGVPAPDTRAKVVACLVREGLVAARGGSFDVTNLGAILFARDLAQFGRLGRKALRVIKYKGTGRTQTEREWVDPPARMGYAAGFEAAVAYINSQLPQNEQIGESLRQQVRIYPNIAIRELVPNALIHQDFSVTGAGPMVEIFDGRMELTNPGEPLVDPQRFLDLPPRSRNEGLAGFMRRLNICEERGSGIDKVIFEIEVYQLPPPDFRAPPGSTQVVLYAPQTFGEMGRAERVRACYQHCALRWISGEPMTNATLRRRFGIADANYSMASRIIRETIEKGLIRRAGPEDAAKKYAPFWA